jgi:hypothetical protein
MGVSFFVLGVLFFKWISFLMHWVNSWQWGFIFFCIGRLVSVFSFWVLGYSGFAWYLGYHASLCIGDYSILVLHLGVTVFSFLYFGLQCFVVFGLPRYSFLYWVTVLWFKRNFVGKALLNLVAGDFVSHFFFVCREMRAVSLAPPS